MAYKPQVLNPADGGTGIANNSASTLAISGNFATTLTVTGTTGVTLPTSGTLATTAQLPSITATQYDVLVGGAANAVVSVGPGSAGQVLQSGGNAANPAYTTATYPATATGTGTILRADGTNWAATTATYPTTTTANQLLYSSATNTVGGLSSAANSTLVTDGSSVPSLSQTLPSAVQGNITSVGTVTSGTWSASTIAINKGGTNATSFTQSNGIVTYNGTSLVNYAGPQISSGGVQTNTTQPAFLAYVNTVISNVTGDNTQYTIIYDTEVYDQGNNFNLGTSTFTAPVTGKYRIDYSVRIGGGTIISNCLANIITSNNSYRREVSLAAGSTTSAGTTVSILADMDASDTFTVQVGASDTGGKVDDVTGVAGGFIFNFLSASLVC